MIQFADGCGDGYLIAHYLSGIWSGSANGGVSSISSAAGRLGSNGFILTASVSPSTLPHGSIWKDVPSRTTYGIALAWRWSASFASDERPIVAFRNASGPQVTIYHLSDGTIQARRGSGATVLGTSASSYSHTTQRHFEAKLFVNNSTGTLQVRVDGVVALNLSGIDTQEQSTDDITQIRVSSGLSHSSNATGNITQYVEDVVILGYDRHRQQ